MLGGEESASPITALEILGEEQARMRITTGAPELDSLVGGIEEGMSYLFYGDPGVLNVLVHQLLVRCTASTKDGGFDSRAIYFNNTDYYTARTTLSPTQMGEFSKRMGIDPERVFRNVFVVAAYNEERQKLVCEKVREALNEYENRYDEDAKIKLVVLHNATCFLPGSKNLRDTFLNLTHILGALKESCSRKAALVVTAGAVSTTNQWRLPKTMGGSFFQALIERDSLPQKVEETAARWSSPVSPGDSCEASSHAGSSFCCFESGNRRCGSVG